MAEEKKFVYYSKNVPYTVVVRYSERDKQGFALNLLHPWVAVPVDRLKDFKMANKQIIMNGLIIESEEPSTDWVTPNALSDEDMDELLRNYLKLKSSLEKINSAPIISKMLERAKDQNKSIKTIGILESRLAELVEEDLIVAREEMKGVS